MKEHDIDRDGRISYHEFELIFTNGIKSNL